MRKLSCASHQRPTYIPHNSVMRILWSTISLLVVGLSAMLLWNAATVLPPSGPVSGVTVEDSSTAGPTTAATTGTATGRAVPTRSSTGSATQDGTTASPKPVSTSHVSEVEAETERAQVVAPVPVTYSPDDAASAEAEKVEAERAEDAGNKGSGSGGSGSDDGADAPEPGED